MKNPWLERNKTVLFWAICSIIYAIIIHLLFHWENGPKWLIAKWGAGDVLTYASTVALGLLALWQNKRFKEENDISQARLEKLTEQANSLAIINKIIDMETSKLKRLKNAIDDFSKACDPAGIVSEFQPAVHSEKDGRLIVSAITARGRIRNSLESISIELGLMANEEIEDLAPFPKCIFKYSEASSKLITILSDSLSIATEDGLKCTSKSWAIIAEQLEVASNLEKEFVAGKNELLLHKEALIDRIVYGNYTIKEIKRLLDEENASFRNFGKVK